ncbi:MAG: hypothetical protein F6K14_25925 [Symploca sp. SIO2C1]|nr:hypothetical protein [Symploca sp. SIO2C1]
MVRIYNIDESDNIDRDFVSIIPRSELNKNSAEKLRLRRATSRTDVPDNATEVIGNNVYEDGSDVDLYGVRLNKDDRLLIDVDARNNDGNGSLSDLNSIIRIFDAEGDRVPGDHIKSVFDTNGNPITDIRINKGIEPDDPVKLFTAPERGVYFIGVSARGNGNYDPWIADKLAPGSRKVVPSQPNREGAFELELRLNPPIDPVPPLPELSINDVSVIEGTGGLPNKAEFTISLNTPSNSPISVTYATADGTAIANQDYIPQSGPLTFAPGATSLPVSIDIIPDDIVELDEKFFVNLSNPVGATIIDSQGIGTIIDDDQAFITEF